MIDDKTTDLLIERLTRRIEKANTYFLKKIAGSIKKIKKLTPSQAQQLIQILKYGEDYNKIIKKISKYTDFNIKDIDEILKKYAKRDAYFNKQFYEYRNIPLTALEENTALNTQITAISNMSKNEMYNYTRSNVLGYSVKDSTGKVVFKGLRETYNEALDTALINVGQGKETFDTAMAKILKDLGESGLRTLNYESGRSIRLDSAVRMHLNARLKELHNETQKIIGEQIGYDGWELSVHINPAPDHEEAQGRQFSIEEYEKLNNGEEAKDYKGRTISLDHDDNGTYRPISELNCRHYAYSIILGVSKPRYTDKELKDIIAENEKGFTYNGKHYTNYEGTQLQRALERKIREQKDLQIIAKEAENTPLVAESQKNISILTSKYKELSNISGLTPKMARMKVAGYRRSKINNYAEIEYARKNNAIWHSTENLEEIINSNKLLTPSISVGKEINATVKYGSQFIEFKPELLENVNKNTLLFKGDGGNKYTRNNNRFNSLIQMLKDEPSIYNEIKLNNDIDALKYIKKVYIREDEPKEVIDLLKKYNIKYKFYKDLKARGVKKK